MMISNKMTVHCERCEARILKAGAVLCVGCDLAPICGGCCAKHFCTGYYGGTGQRNKAVAWTELTIKNLGRFSDRERPSFNRIGQIYPSMRGLTFVFRKITGKFRELRPSVKPSAYCSLKQYRRLARAQGLRRNDGR